MPLSVDINLRILGDFNPDNLSSMNTALQALFLNWFHNADPQIAQELHENEVKPYTISPLYVNAIGVETRARFRVTLLKDSLWVALERSMFHNYYFKQIL